MGVIGALVNFELGQQPATEAILGNHSFDGMHDQVLRALGANFGHIAIAFATLPTGIAHEHLVGFLLAGEVNFLGINDNNKVTRIQVRGKDRLVLSAKDVGDLDSETTQYSTFGIDDVPFSLIQIHFGQIRFHYQTTEKSGERIKVSPEVNRTVSGIFDSRSATKILPRLTRPEELTSICSRCRAIVYKNFRIHSPSSPTTLRREVPFVELG